MDTTLYCGQFSTLHRHLSYLGTTPCRHLPNMDPTHYRHLSIIASSHLLTKLFYFFLKHIKNDDGDDNKTKHTNKTITQTLSSMATDTTFQPNWPISNNLTSFAICCDKGLMLNTAAFQPSYGNFAITVPLMPNISISLIGAIIICFLPFVNFQTHSK